MNAQQIQLVKATVPALRAHGEDITRHFYADMFRAHPELLNIFNPANQSTGKQARSLAASVLAYAEHIDDAGRLGGMVERIAHKHVSLEVQPEHYPIVGEHLLGAIAAVLGDAATPEILDAWAAAYGQLAELMIRVEGEMYTAGATQPGGWHGFKPFRVTEKKAESSEITSFVLEPVDGQPLPRHRAGQYLALRVKVPGQEHFQIRQYSLSAPWDGRRYRISVKREPGGLVSGHLHDGVRVGSELAVHLPAGDFTLPEPGSVGSGAVRPLVMLSGGVGITPLLAMLRELLEQGSSRPVTFVHAVRGREVQAFHDEITGLITANPQVKRATFYETVSEGDMPGVHFDQAGQISLDALRPYLPADAQQADYYYCGPVGFVDAVEALLDALRVPATQRFTETFGPSQSFSAVIPA
ncbi:flavohemoprotein [Deinococcus piscis]|uniref:nitric oxide dioxygenase n=1 Tax=Deinococcus piscis TaxID=394230 RepID=A0ABQ3K8L3_9DEIO|nr:NO-inducible flavohemoprotein [Deinococcus piscis]GHG02779.1 flavohemoprotein [Deinococcus piscis]